MELKKIYSISNPIAENNNSTKLPGVIRLYPSANSVTGDLLKISEEAVPFFVNFFNETSSSESNVENETGSVSFRYVKTVLEERKRRLSKEFIIENFWVYNITDYGHQSLSPGFDDFIAVCYDASGYKIPQRFTAYIKNYTTKEAFLLVKKDVGSVSPITKITILPNDRFELNTSEIPLTQESENGFYSVVLSNDNKINSANDISVYFKKGTEVYELQSSEYFLDIRKLTAGENDSLAYNSNTYVSKQENYFNDVFNAQLEKNYLGLTLKINTILNHDKMEANDYDVFIRIKGRATTFYRYSYNTFRSGIIEFPLTENIDIYRQKLNSVYQMEKLIPGIDYYVQNKVLTIVGAANNTLFEVFIRHNIGRSISMPFLITDIGDAPLLAIGNLRSWLYNSNIVDWNIDISTSKIDLYEDGRLVLDATPTFSISKKYEYFIYDIALGSSEIPSPAISEDQIERVSLRSTQSFDNFNKPTVPVLTTIFTDPYFNTYGETSGYIETINTINTNTTALPVLLETLQEVFLYDRLLNIKLADRDPETENESKEFYVREPSISVNGGKHTLLDRDSTLMDTIIGDFIEKYSYYVHNDDITFADPENDPTDIESGRSLFNTVSNSADAILIENQIAQVKKNWKQSLLNYKRSGAVPFEYTDNDANKDLNRSFWMLVIEPELEGSEELSDIVPFNIEYYSVINNTERLVKKEYNCSIDDDGTYYSIPFFLDSFAESSMKSVSKIKISYNADISNSSERRFKFITIK
jgi:hypothetical protein